jgi:general secretion pathway protein D
MVRVANPGWSPPVGRSISIGFMLLSIVLLASCNSATVNSGGGLDIDVIDKVRSLDTLPRYPQQVNAAEANAGQRSRPVVFEGTEVSDVSEPRPQPVATGNGFELNFENTPVATVAKVVLGDILQTGYTIDPRVQGTVSPYPDRWPSPTLSSCSRTLCGLVGSCCSRRLRLPFDTARRRGRLRRVDAAASSPEPGYGVSVVPLQYVSAQTLLKLMDSFATKAGMVRADTTRNLLLIQGSGAERRTAVDTALSFDLDWMRGQSVGIFPIANSAPEAVIAELEKIVDLGENGLSANLIKFQSVARLNAIMA